MPTSPLMNIPTSKSADEFEDMCTDVLIKVYKQRFTRYGRNGQKQNGIDIRSPQINKSYAVAQCKNYFSHTPISANNLVKQIETDVNSAKAVENKDFQICKFIAMTSTNRDKNVQDDIARINKTFEIELWFWEEIQAVICNNEDLMRKYYPTFCDNMHIPVSERNRMIENIKIIRSETKKFHDHHNHKLGYNTANDIYLYNLCVSIFTATAGLSGLQGQLYMQLQEIDVVDVIDNIIKNVPDFYPELQNGYGIQMIYTISGFQAYFCLDNNLNTFIEYCDKALQKIKSV